VVNIRKFFFWLVVAVCSNLRQFAANCTVAVVVYGPVRFAAVCSNPREAYIFYGSLQQPAQSLYFLRQSARSLYVALAFRIFRTFYTFYTFCTFCTFCTFYTFHTFYTFRTFRTFYTFYIFCTFPID